MGFQQSARKVRDPSLSPWRRLSALRGCIASLSGLPGEGYRATLARYDRRFGFDRRRDYGPSDPPSEALLLEVLRAVEAERAACLARLVPFARERREAKERGNRQLSRAERAAYAALARPGEEAGVDARTWPPSALSSADAVSG